MTKQVYFYIHKIAESFPPNKKVLLKTERVFETPYCFCAELINHKDLFPNKTIIQIDKSKIENKQFNQRYRYHDIILNTNKKSFVGKDDRVISFYDYEITGRNG